MSFILAQRVSDIENLLKNTYNLFMAIHLKLPKPPSINCAYAGYPKRHKSDKYKDWIKQADNALKTQLNYSIQGDNWLNAMYILWTPLHFKNGNKRVIDIWNYEKIVSDYLSGWKKPENAKIQWFYDHKIQIMTLLKKESWECEECIEIIIDEIQ